MGPLGRRRWRQQMLARLPASPPLASVHEHVQQHAGRPAAANRKHQHTATLQQELNTRSCWVPEPPRAVSGPPLARLAAAAEMAWLQASLRLAPQSCGGCAGRASRRSLLTLGCLLGSPAHSKSISFRVRFTSCALCHKPDAVVDRQVGPRGRARRTIGRQSGRGTEHANSISGDVFRPRALCPAEKS